MSASLRRRLQGWWRRSGNPAGATDAPAVHEVSQNADDVERYWTDERMRAARAREQKLPLPEDHGRSEHDD
jgi:hypothetical protein